ncbi:MAG: DinB family protein [Vicinamibacterales bacterium]
MPPHATELRDEVHAALPRLRAMSEEWASQSRGAGRWIRKEILGHLIDSAANNHQRIVRARFSDPFVWPDYDGNAWVPVHGYGARPWTELVDLWAGLNGQVAAAMASVPSDRLETSCRIGGDPPVSLDWLMRDYVRHLRHHLAQILGE